MATPKSQRIGIWVITFVLAAGTLGSFLVMGLSVQNNASDQKRLKDAYSKYQLDVTSQTYELSGKYYGELNKYSSQVGAFDGSNVKELVKEDLKIGTGEEIKSDTKYQAYYIGWNPKGVVFDQSIKDGSLQAPMPSYDPLTDTKKSLITGWSEGVIGMKKGGVRELTIPSDQAYGETGSGENIPANTPLKFIIMIITDDEVEAPKILKDYFASQGQ